MQKPISARPAQVVRRLARPVLLQPPSLRPPPPPASRDVAALAASQLVLHPTHSRRRTPTPAGPTCAALLALRSRLAVCTSRRLTSPPPRCGSRWARAWSATAAAGRPAPSSSSSTGALRPADHSPRRHSPRAAWCRQVQAGSADAARLASLTAQAIELPARHLRAVPGPPGQRQAHLRAHRRGPCVQGVHWRGNPNPNPHPHPHFHPHPHP